MREPITLEADFEAESEQVVTTGDIVDWRTRADAVARKIPAPIELADLQEVSPAPIKHTEAPRYLTRRLLGKGGMGEVRLCKDFRIGRSVAMKVLHADAAADADAQLRFVQEAQIQGQLEHPAIPPVYDLGLQPDGTLFFTMKRLRGRTLAEILRGLRAGQPALLQQFSLQRLLESFLTVCRAVQYAHTRGILHRDLKPQNIMLGDFGEVYVMDWGIAKLLEVSFDDMVPLAERSAESAVRPSVDRKKTSPHSILGTLAYAAPEQVTPSQKDSVDERTDVFALGAILFEMLTWKRARPVAAPEEMLKSITHPGQQRASIRIPSHQVPTELEAIYTRAMQHSPQARYPSVAAMLADLEQFLSGEHAHDRLRQLTVHQRRLEGAGDDALAITLEQPHTEQTRAPGARSSARAAGLGVLDTLPQSRTASSLSHPSRHPSPETTAEHESSRPGREDARVRTVAVVGVVLVFATLLALAMHVRDWGMIALLCVAGVVCSGMRIWNLIHPASSRLPYAVHLSSLLFFALLGRVFGPLSLMTMLVAMDTSLQATSSSHRFRRFAVLSSCAMVLGVVLLEWSGALSASYLFTQGGMLLRPNLMDLSPGPTYIVLMIVSMLAIAAPTLNFGARSAR